MIAPPILLLVLCFVPQDDEKWEVFAPKGYGFAVELPPGDNQKGETPFVGPGGAGTLNQVLRGTDDLYCDLKVYVPQRPIARADEARWLDYVRDEETGFGKGRKVAAEKPFRVGTVVGREITFGPMGPDQVGFYEAKGRAFVRGSAVFVLVASSRKNKKPLTPAADRFLESFAFGTKPSPAGLAAFKAGEEARTKAEAAVPNTWKPLPLLKDRSSVTLPREASRSLLGGNLDSPLDGFYESIKIAETPAAHFVVVLFRNEEGKAPPSSGAKAREVAIKWAVAQIGQVGKITADEPIRSAAGVGREVTMTVDRGSKGGLVDAKGRIYFDRDAIYALVVVARAQGKPLPPEDTARFLDSLTMTTPIADPTEGLQGWGMPVDPDGDVRIAPAGAALTMEIPGTPHVLAPERDKMNAPRVVRPVAGDFVAVVRVDGKFQPARPSTLKGLSSRTAAGLIIWRDAGNYLVFQHRATADEGDAKDEAVLEELVAGRKGAGHRQPLGEGPAYLRLERKGGRITAASSSDGKAWQDLKPVEATWAQGEIQVGIMAVSTSTNPHAVNFTKFAIDAR